MSDELPPLDFVKLALRRTWPNWENSSVDREAAYALDNPDGDYEAVIAHARTLAKYEKPPVDEAELKRRQDAREAAAYCAAIVGLLSTADAMRGGALDENASIQSAYIALCHRDRVTPTPVSEWSDK